MFEALFILTVIDAGTRVGRFLVGEFLGRAYAPLAKPNWLPGSMLTTLIVVVAWAYFIWTGNISTIWPMFGIANQLLATVALAIGTTILINLGRARYAWVTLAPMTFLGVTTLTAGFLTVKNNFIPMATGPNEALHFQGTVNTALTITMMILVVIILGAAVRKWLAVGKTGVDPDLVPSGAAGL
jgi:carbon starvation protein